MIDETVEQIEDMRTHSSSEVAVTALSALRSVVDVEHATVEEYLRSLARNARALRHADPSHASLFTSTKAVETAVDEADPDSIDAAKAATLDAIDDEIDRITQAKERAAEAALDVIEPGGTYLTIDYSTTVLETLRRTAAGSSDPVTMYALEARPRYLGRKFARELGQMDGIDARLVVDNAAGSVVGGCDAVVVGMTCVVDETLYNRVGTYSLALAADAAGVPMYAVGADAKVVDDAFVFSSDERPSSEVSLEPLDAVAIENYQYDETPVDLLAGVITDAGVRFADG